ncbi:MAG: DUF934 domain-containing protein [Maricaulaceae bacterium]|jgi:uncharacterized protein (DUF934 family)
MPLIKDGKVVEDGWVALDDEAAPPNAGDVIVSYARVLDDASTLLQRDGRLGVRVSSSDEIEALVPHLPSLHLVALEFPKYRDGRAYSSARLLRERYGFEGELRAVGDVLRDQLFFMVRCGFDAFEIDHADAAKAFAEAVNEFSAVYQPTGDGRRHVWAARSESSSGARTQVAAE